MPVENVKGVDKSKVKKAEQLKEVARNKEPKPDEATSSQKQRKPRVRKEKTPKDKKEATNSSKKLETEKGKPSNEPLVKNKPKAAIDRDSGVCSKGSNLQQLSSETDDDVQVVTNHRKLHTRALSTSSEESNISSKFRVSEEQTLACGNSLYDLGTVVWAKIEGYPWWPAMVDDDPDFGTHIWVEENFKEPTWYHVTFFDTQVVTRAWVRPDHISAYNMPIVAANKCQKMFAARLKGSIKQAENAIEMSWSGRVAKYGFVVRYPNGVGDLKKQREEKRKQEKIAEAKRKRQKEKYMELIKKQVAKSNKGDVEKKKKNNLLRLYSSEVGKELQNCVDSMFDMKGKGEAINEITRMLTTENQNVNVPLDPKENINDTSIDILQMENENDHVPINCY
ncbi:unnamed protein product [Callosobruchus maculatus]|nr:unnamed protein product [Callosobruchus maculatus]